MATNLIDLIDTVTADDLPTNEFTIEDKDPMVILGKINEVIANLQMIQSIISASDTKANQALENALIALQNASTALSSSNTALSTANEAIATANTAIEEVNNAIETAESAETKADNAVATASSADAKADEAVATANEALEQVVEGQGTKVSVNGVVQSSFDMDTITDRLDGVDGSLEDINQDLADLANNKANVSEVQANFTLVNSKNTEQDSRLNTLETMVDDISGELETQQSSINTLSSTKQNALSTEQLNATNSGVTQSKVQDYEAMKQQYLKNASVSDNTLELEKQDGTKVTFAGGGGGGVTMTELWTNPNPSNVFNPQTLTLDLTEYKFFIIYFYATNTWQREYQEICVKNISSRAILPKQTFNGVNIRQFKAVDTGFIFYDGYNPSTDNTVGIPIKIYGVK